MAYEEIIIGDCRLIHGDCREVLPTLSGIDAVVTDPPYGIHLKGGTWGKKFNLQWDRKAPDILNLLNISDCICIWGGNYFPLPPSRGWLSWFKPDRVPTTADFELAWTSRDMNARQITHSIAATNAERVNHPTQKPVRVMTWCIEQISVQKPGLVLDPFMGSGTTGVACAQLGLSFTGIELERKYFDIAVKRIERAQAQGKLLLPDAPQRAVQEGLL